MRGKRIIWALLLLLPLWAGAQGRRIPAGEAFLEPVTPRDSVLIADQLLYGMELKNVTEGTPLALPALQPQEDSPLAILGTWQLDSTRISRRKEVPARYDIRASLRLTAAMGGTYQLPALFAVVDADTLVFKPQQLVVTEPAIDMESFEPHDIKPQVKFPYTFVELFPWIWGGAMVLMALTALILWLVSRGRKVQEALREAEPAHIRALRQLDKFRGDKYWQPEHQKTFYSGVTDALREYIASRYGVGALEMTTAEIFEGLKGTDVPPELYEEMKALFERADFVKFAKFTATDEENAKVLPQAVRFVTTTYQQEIAGQAGNDEKPAGNDEKPAGNDEKPAGNSEKEEEGHVL